MSIKKERIVNFTINTLFYLCVVGVSWILSSIFFFSSFKIPSESMSPELVAGDNVLVCKPIIGARLFDVFASMKGEQPSIYRLFGMNTVKHNDVLVFNFPYPKSWDKMEMHIMQYYIKRCVGLPGDTLSIVNGLYQVSKSKQALGNQESQANLGAKKSEFIEEGVFNAFPFDSIMRWNIKDFGPLYIPRQGGVIAMNREAFVLYKKLIEWEQQTALHYMDSVVYLGQEQITEYCFNKNYYFVAGDKVEDSQDSRYWGLLPEEYIVGKAWIIWKSVDPYVGKFKWERFLKKIN